MLPPPGSGFSGVGRHDAAIGTHFDNGWDFHDAGSKPGAGQSYLGQSHETGYAYNATAGEVRYNGIDLTILLPFLTTMTQWSISTLPTETRNAEQAGALSRQIRLRGTKINSIPLDDVQRTFQTPGAYSSYLL
jgi:hypothetical protein